MYEKALSIRLKKLGKNHPDVAIRTITWLSIHNQGKYEEASAMYKKDLSIKWKKLGDDHPVLLLRTITWLSIHKQGKSEEALTSTKRSVDQIEELGKPSYVAVRK